MKLSTRISLICTALLLEGGTLYGQSPTTQGRYEQLVQDYFGYFERGATDSAEMALRGALLLDPENKANFLLQANLAELVVARRDTAEAISLLSQALSSHPEMDDIRSRRAELFQAMGRSEDALLDLETLIPKHPESEVYRFRRALIFVEKGLWPGAGNDLEAILKLNPNSYLSQATLAAVQYEKGEEVEAERILTKLTTEYPDLHVAARALTGLYLSQGRLSEALSTIRKVIQDGKVVTKDDYLTRAAVWQAYGENGERDKDITKAKERGATPSFVEKYLPPRGEKSGIHSLLWTAILVR